MENGDTLDNLAMKHEPEFAAPGDVLPAPAPASDDPGAGKQRRKRSRDSRACVSRACIRCKAAKKCCDEQRPCQRCVRMGLGDQCYDAKHMKPGRKPKPLSEIIGYDPSQTPPAFSENSSTQLPILEFTQPHLLLQPNVWSELLSSAGMNHSQLFELASPVDVPGHTSAMSQWFGSFCHFMEKMKQVGQALAAGMQPMSMELYQILSQYLLIQGERFGIPKDLLQKHRAELWNIDDRVEGAIRRYLDLRRQNRPKAPAQVNPKWAPLMDLPVGVIAISHRGPDIFVNNEAARLFGYKERDQLYEQLQSDMDAVFIRHLHPGDWQRAMPTVMTSIARRDNRTSTRTRAFTVSGMMFEMTMTIIYEYDPTGVPVSTMMYLMGVDMDATQTATAAPTTTDIAATEVHTTTGSDPLYTSFPGSPPPPASMPQQFTGVPPGLDMSSMAGLSGISGIPGLSSMPGMPQLTAAALQQFMGSNIPHMTAVAQLMDQLPLFGNGPSGDESHMQ